MNGFAGEVGAARLCALMGSPPPPRRMAQRQRRLELIEALGSSLDLRVVMERAMPILQLLVPADYCALGVSSSGRPEDYEWIAVDLPLAFFAAYPEMAPADFVRKSLSATPNVVLRDEDMLRRAELEDNVMYRRAREVGAPLEQVMAVMLHIDDRWQSGISLYRDKRHPFTTEDRDLLQSVSPFIRNTVRNCHLFGTERDRAVALETLLRPGHGARLVVTSAGIVLEQTEAAARILEAWFEPHERSANCLPRPLAEVVSRFSSSGNQGHGESPPPWTRRRDDDSLEITFHPGSRPAQVGTWTLLVRERLNVLSLPVPTGWRAVLTNRQQEVAAQVLRGWSNDLIADHLGCATATIKRHLKDIFDRVGVESRSTLIARAATSHRPD